MSYLRKMICVHCTHSYICTKKWKYDIAFYPDTKWDEGKGCYYITCYQPEECPPPPPCYQLNEKEGEK